MRRNIYERDHHPGRKAPGGHAPRPGGEKQRTPDPRGHGAPPGALPDPGLSPPQRRGGQRPHPPASGLRGPVGGAGPGRGCRAPLPLGHPRLPDAGDALLGHLPGGHPRPVRPGGDQLPRRVRAGPIADRLQSFLHDSIQETFYLHVTQSATLIMRFQFCQIRIIR